MVISRLPALPSRFRPAHCRFKTWGFLNSGRYLEIGSSNLKRPLFPQHHDSVAVIALDWEAIRKMSSRRSGRPSLGRLCRTH